jgi:pimeloyl-ACP methyl ester carboxylesterase
MPYATNDGVRIHYHLEGNPAGPPLLLHHFLSGGLRDWYGAGHVEALAGTYRLIVIDARGHGLSDKPHDPAAYSYAQRIADVVAVLDGAGIERAVFWGYSLGGLLGYVAARTAPERFRAFVIGGNPPPPSSPNPEMAGAFAAALRGGMAGLVDMFEGMGGPLDASHREMLLAQDADALLANMIAADEGLNYPATITDPARPMLIYVGDRDAGHDAAQFAAGQAGVPFVSLPGLDHFTGFARSDAVLPHVRAFLDGLPGAEPAS